MRRKFFFLLPFLFFASNAALAQTVIYTTVNQPVDSPAPGVVVQMLEDVNRLEKQLFPSLTAEPVEAEMQARLRMQQADWKIQEARLTRAYQALLDAHTTGITKVPAVVFDGHYVVYGTTDVALALKKWDAWREVKP